MSAQHRGRYGGYRRRPNPMPVPPKTGRTRNSRYRVRPSSPPRPPPPSTSSHGDYQEVPSRWRRLIPGQRWRERLERYLYPPAALLVSLPTIVIAGVVVCAPGLLLDWQAAAFLAAVWLVSGVAVFIPQDTAMVARVAYRFRRPSPDEGGMLESAWGTVTSAASVDGSVYSLWVQDSKTVNAFAAAGRLVGATDWAVFRLPPRQLEAVLAHELGHHLDGPHWVRLLARWYGLPFTLIFRLIGHVVMATVLFVRVEAERRDWQVPECAMFASVIAWGTGLLTVYLTIGVVLILLFGWLGALVLVVLLVAQPLAEAALSRLGETRADRVAVELGYGQELCEVLRQWAAEPAEPTLPPIVNWLDSHPSTDQRIATIRARMGCLP
ncbi:M48 family metalloprotease [Nocardia sp. NPDC046763]|uniref:M48 family metalloprotease n=1 Tax=Nocardia sp. NPDC046763 TaxID=3155256 RepID=UPI0033CCFBC7